MHESAVDVSVEQVGHGQDCAVTQRTEVTTGALPCLALRLVLRRFLRTIIQQIHEQREIPATTK